jgi:glucose/mannose-6-phosphate isomerase
MGGSVLGTHVIQTLYKDHLQVPVVIAPDYTVPSFVNEETLVIASSYSGTTEETLSAVKDAHAKGAQITGITSGGALAEFLHANNYPVLVFETEFNPCDQPRMGLGYSIFGQMAVFAQAGLIEISEADYQQVLEVIAQMHLQYSIEIPQQRNLAKLLAYQALDKIPVITAAEHLEGMAHVFANQLNENAKTFSEYRIIPELNHHLMEGLQFPHTLESSLLWMIFDSTLYVSANQNRLRLTQQVLEKHHLESEVHQLQAQTPVGQAFELLMLGTYTAYYLALLNHVNPSPIPNVDWFKAELKKM